MDMDHTDDIRMGKWRLAGICQRKEQVGASSVNPSRGVSMVPNDKSPPLHALRQLVIGGEANVAVFGALL